MGLKASCPDTPCPELSEESDREGGERRAQMCLSTPTLTDVVYPRLAFRCAWATPDVSRGFREKGYESILEPINSYPVSQINVRLVPVLICLWCVTMSNSHTNQVKRLMFIPRAASTHHDTLPFLEKPCRNGSAPWVWCQEAVVLLRP